MAHLDTVGVRGSNPRAPTIFMSRNGDLYHLLLKSTGWAIAI